MRHILSSLFIVLLFFAFACKEQATQKEVTKTKVLEDNIQIEFEDDIEIEPPQTAESPPPPPIIEKVPEEELEFEEEIVEFADQTIGSETNAYVSSPKKVLPPPPPPPSSPPNVEACFKKQDYRNTEEYAPITENQFHTALQTPLSTFSIDVDNASYSNCRRYISNGNMPSKGAVRIEEFINYFDYDYPQPKGDTPFSITTELSDCPWQAGHRLVHIGLQGKELLAAERPASNLTFLIDVSGSMSNANKLPLLKKAFRLLINQLGEQDRVAIVVYAGASGVVLPSTPATEKEKIFASLEQLEAGGSTAGAAGIELAYQIAEKNLLQQGNNRIILATDGDFNIGVSSTDALVTMIEEKREKGVFLSVLGFGMGNYKDSRMEQLADNGNGNYAYIDNLREAKKVFVNDLTGTLFTIAKDVKIQIEFNPTHVKEYRLIGYENRKLNDEDFNDDKKDAGELGAGHTVTALYEIIPTTISTSSAGAVDELKYQERKLKEGAKASSEWMTVKLRYKQPEATKSQLITETIRDANTDWSNSSDNFRFSAAVAGFGLLLRDSKYKGALSYTDVAKWARAARAKDEHAYRAEFIELVELADAMQGATISRK